MEKLSPSRIRLGQFELNLQTGELRPLDQQVGLILREQPFQILKMLIEHGEKLVTREEMRKRLWPNDTLVNFDHSINVAIGILRRALGDSAEAPKYIETVARRGYRLRVTAEPLHTFAGMGPHAKAEAKEDPTTFAGMIGKKVSHYRVIEAIGGGGMGMVYRAEDLRLGRRVALKFLPPEVADDPLTLRRFEREAQTASTLNHPNICTVYEIDEQDAQPFIVMELLEGASLNHVLNASAPSAIPAPRLLEIALQICDGLQAAHDKGIIHRDIKPANIFLTASGPAKILDFGLAKLMDPEAAAEVEQAWTPDAPIPSQSAETNSSDAMRSSLTLTGAAMGTASYMSPEQVRGEKLDVTTDLFSFGVVLYEAATGQRAFVGDTAAIVHEAVINTAPVSARLLNPAIPRALDLVVAKALQKDSSLRYQSAAEMRRALEQVGTDIRPEPPHKVAWFALAVLLVVALAGGWRYWSLNRRLNLSRSDTIVLAVTNETKDPVFDDAIYTAVFFGLQQTPYIHVLETDKLREALWRLHLPDNAKRTPSIGRRVCLQTHSKLVAATAIAEEGNGFRIEAQAVSCQSGKAFVTVAEYAPDRDQVIRVLGLTLAQLRKNIGEPAASIETYNKPLDVAMSASPEALQLLTDGYRHILAFDLREGALDLQRAIALDSNLVMAYTALAGIEDTLENGDLARVAATKGFALRERATLPVRMQAEDLYYDIVTGEQEKNYVVLSNWVRLYPDDFIAHNNFMQNLRTLGRPDQALTEAREAARLFPSPWSYGSLIATTLATDRLAEATTQLEDADARKFDGSDLRNLRVSLAFLQRDPTAMQPQWNWAVGKPHIDHAFLFGRGTVDAYYGKFKSYRRLTLQAADLAAGYGDASDVVRYNNALALDEAEVGTLPHVQHSRNQSVPMAQSAQTEPAFALAQARGGDAAQAQAIVEKMNRESPLSTIVQSYYLPIIRAAMKLQTHDPAAAIQILNTAKPYDLSYAPYIASLYPAYIRGQAYLQMGEESLASAEFQKVLDHPGIVGADVIGALTYLQMGRAQKAAGKTAAARKSYEYFLTLWKDADPDLPVYQQAKAEYASLASR